MLDCLQAMKETDAKYQQKHEATAKVLIRVSVKRNG
jgi:hypothetical protein